jgi:hypothetical protein
MDEARRRLRASSPTLAAPASFGKRVSDDLIADCRKQARIAADDKDDILPALVYVGNRRGDGGRRSPV